jgi:hypothetical protein
VKGTVFSVPGVIQFVNEYYVPVELDLTNQGFPNLEADRFIKSAFERTYHCRFGFSVNVVLNPDLTFPIGTAVGGEETGLEFAVEYHSKYFLNYLKVCLRRYTASLTMTPEQLIQLEDEVFDDDMNVYKD